MHVRFESHVAAVGSSGVSRALLSGKMHVNRGDVLLHHLPLDLKILTAALLRSVSVPGVWIQLDVECAGSVWDRLPGDFKSWDSPRSDRDMSAVRCS